MAERINHAAKSLEILESYPGAIGNRPFDVAQVHATLALAEQQRIANLIALKDVPVYEYETTPEGIRQVLNKEIKEVLGL